MFLFITQLPADQFKYWVDVLAASSSVFTAFIAIVSIAIAFFSLREARRQRESSYQPDLYLAFPSTAKSRITNFQTGYREVECIVIDDQKETETWGIWHSIENIGLGSAKDVKIQWDFDFKQAYAAIQNEVKEPLKVKVADGADLDLLDKDGDSLISTTSSYSESLIKYDFVLPRKEEKFDKSPSIPQEIHEAFAIMFLVRTDIFNLKKLDKLYSESYEDFPPLTAHMTYSDIGGKSYSKKFRVKLSSSIWAYNEDEVDLKKIKKLDFNLHAETEVIE